MATPLHKNRHDKYPTDRKKVVVPVAGVCNAELKGLSTALVSFRMLRRALTAAGVEVTNPIVPERLGLGFGVIGNIDSVYERFQQRVDTSLAPYGPFARPVFLAHSFGGLLALRDHALRGSAGVLTAGTPHGKMPGLPLEWMVPGWIKSRTPYARWCGQAARFSTETLDMLNGSERLENVTFLGSTEDRVVQSQASVPAVAGVRRVLFGADERSPVGFSGEYIQAGTVKHNGLLTNQIAAGFMVHNIVELVDPLAYEPIPDNVVYGNFPQLQPAF